MQFMHLLLIVITVVASYADAVDVITQPSSAYKETGLHQVVDAPAAQQRSFTIEQLGNEFDRKTSF